MMRHFAAATLAMSMLTGCYTTRVASPAKAGASVNDDTQYHFIYGLTSSKVAAIECTHGIASVEFELPWWHIFLGAITLGLVDSTTTKYSCVDQAAAGETSEAPKPAASSNPVAAF